MPLQATDRLHIRPRTGYTAARSRRGRCWMKRAILHAVVLATAGLCVACSGAPRTDPADLVLLGGKIVTLDPQRPEARALAARDGRILAVGADEEIRPLAGPDTEVIELDGALAVPGFIEGHAHFTGIGHALTVLDLTEARSWDEIVALAAQAARSAEDGRWILGHGWHQEKWDAPVEPSVEGYPTHVALSAATPRNPVLFKHAAGSHAGMVNARAMELAGIDASTPDPEGGTILRDRKGRPTGVLRETAYGLALTAHERSRKNMTPQELADETRHHIELADRECLSRGITSFQDAGSDFATVDLMKRMAEADELGLRLWVMLSAPADVLAKRIDEYAIRDAGDHRLTVRAIKKAVDGALGSHGAWLLEPYSDLPATSGLNTTSLDEIRRTAEIAVEHDFQLCVHAIGDRGNREILDLYEQIFALHPERDDLRWRIEHAQHLHPDDIPRFAELGVIASMQGVHCTSDGPWVPLRLGQTRSEQGAYVWRELIDSGAVVSNGTDAPVEDVDPVANFHATVTRRMGDGRAFYPEQRMTRHEALRAATIDAAYAAFEEGIKGSLEPGKLADVTVLSHDILTVPEEDIPGTEVVYTIVGGRVLYARPDATRSASARAAP